MAAWVDPATRTTGELITAATWNQDIRDNELWLARDKPHCRLFRTADVIVPNNSNLQIGFTDENFDVGSMHSTGTSITLITIPTGGAGRYHFGGNVEWAPSSVGRRELKVLRNGVSIIASNLIGAGVSTEHTQIVTGFFDLAVGDTLELRVFQNTGGNLNVTADGAGNYSPTFWAAWYGFSGGV